MFFVVNIEIETQAMQWGEKKNGEPIHVYYQSLFKIPAENNDPDYAMRVHKRHVKKAVSCLCTW